MDKPKVKVSWTLDEEVIKAVKAKAAELSLSTGVRVSESATANLLLKGTLERPNEKEN